MDLFKVPISAVMLFRGEKACVYKSAGELSAVFQEGDIPWIGNKCGWLLANGGSFKCLSFADGREDMRYDQRMR